jgi:hypothetical protein
MSVISGGFLSLTGRVQFSNPSAILFGQKYVGFNN